MTASADGEALRRAVCAAPDDDLPRLVYADWLDENGDPDRAAFIRVQCEQARIPWMSARWRKLARVEAELWRKHRKAWEATLTGLTQFMRFGRGFVDGVTLSARQFLTNGPAIFDEEPVQAVKFVGSHRRGWGVPLTDLLASPVMPQVRSLDLTNRDFTATDCAHLAAAGRGALAGVRAVTVVNFKDSGPSPAASSALPQFVRAWPALSAVELHLTHHSATAMADLTALLTSPAFRKIASLDATHAPVWAAAWEALETHPYAVGLRRLSVSTRYGLRPAPEIIDIIARSPHLARLTRLDLAGRLDPEATSRVVAALGVSKTLRSLEILDLTGCPVTDADVQALAGAAFAPKLKVLVVRQSNVPKANAKRFAGLFPQAEVVV